MINILSNYEPFTKNLINHYNLKKIKFYRKFDKEIFENHLIVVEPIQIADRYCSINSIWQNFLLQEYPENKLIVLGLHNFKHSNYIDFLHFPNDLNHFIIKAKPVRDGFVKYPEEGFNVHQKMKQFFKGHGGNSVKSQLTKIQFSIEAIYSNLDDFVQIKNDLIPNYLLPELEDLMNRWKSYSIYFPFLPFQDLLNSIQDSLQSITNEFSKNISRQKIIDIQFQKIINDIVRSLFLIDRKYIGPELYEENIICR